MQRIQAYKFELRPDGHQEQQMRLFAGSSRFVFNRALALQKARYEQGDKKLGYAGMCMLLTDWRNSTDTAWLANAPVHPLQQALKDLERAYVNYFAKRANLPRFKKKGQRGSSALGFKKTQLSLFQTKGTNIWQISKWLSLSVMYT